MSLMAREVHSSSDDAIPQQRADARAHEGEPCATVIVNADDWGAQAVTTDRILDCIRHGSVSSTSAMVFMEDSERAADVAREYGVSTGLHLNLTEAFTGTAVPSPLRDEHA